MAPYREETLTIGSKPSVFQTAPPQPASKARRTWYSELVGGAEASQKGFGALTPQNSTVRSTMKRPLWAERDIGPGRVVRKATGSSPPERGVDAACRELAI